MPVLLFSIPSLQTKFKVACCTDSRSTVYSSVTVLPSLVRNLLNGKEFVRHDDAEEVRRG
jgi:hypothetical protein